MATDPIGWRRIALALVGLWLLGGAIYVFMAPDRVPSFVLINNTGAKIVVHVDDTSVMIGPGKSGELTNDLRNLQPFFIETPVGRRNSYTWMPIGDQRFIGGNHLYWQIEPDHKIYMLLPAPIGDSKDIPSQPAGYPLEPR